MAYHMTLIALTVLLGAVCQADEAFDVPVAAWEIPADATLPENSSNPYRELSTPNLDPLNEPASLQKYFEQARDASAESNSARGRQSVPFFDSPSLAPAIAKPKLLPYRDYQEDSATSDPTPWVDDTEVYNRQTAAIVNRVPILKGEILDRYVAHLREVRDYLRSKMRPQSEYRQQRDALVERDLPYYIQHWVVADAMATRLSSRQLMQMRTLLEVKFAKEEVPKLLHTFCVKTRDELETVLHDLGTTLGTAQKNFIMCGLAREFVSRELARDDVVSEDEMKAYYKAHRANYAIPAKIDWQQIQITFFDEYSKEAAHERMRRALHDLRSEVSVKEVANNYSDGATAKQGGAWNSMVAGTLADKKLELLLFEMPVGQWSGVYERPTELQLVRVVDRSATGTSSYETTKGKVRRELNRIRMSNSSLKMLSDAKIESEYDLSKLYNVAE